MKLTPIMKRAIERMRGRSLAVCAEVDPRTARALVRAKICETFGANERAPWWAGGPTVHLFLLTCFHCKAKGEPMAFVNIGADAVCPRCAAQGKGLPE